MAQNKSLRTTPQTPENEAVPFLKKIAAVKEEYRDIPIVQVNRFLMDHYNKENGRAVFSEEKLEVFINLGSKMYTTWRKRNLNAKYVNMSRTTSHALRLPKEVTLGYPIEFLQSKHFKIVDTPGIHAIAA